MLLPSSSSIVGTSLIILQRLTLSRKHGEASLKVLLLKVLLLKVLLLTLQVGPPRDSLHIDKYSWLGDRAALRVGVRDGWREDFTLSVK